MTTQTELEPGTILRAALEYAARGWWVFPVAGQRGGEHAARWKSPHSVGRWSVESTRDPAKITRWFDGNDDLGIAIDMGRSGLVALDGDHMEGLIAWAGEDNLADAPSWRGNPLRRSWIFTQPTDGDPIGCPIREWGEVKGAGGYMIAPPSPHPIGGNYAWVSEGETPPLPAEIADRLRTTPSGRGQVQATEATSEEIRTFIDRHTAALRPELMQSVLNRYNESISAGAGRYPSVRDCLAWGLEEAAAGLYSARDVVVALGAAYREDLSRPPARRFDQSEWQRVLAWAVGKAMVADVDDRLARAAATEVSVTTLDVAAGGDLTDPEQMDLALMAYEREVAQRMRSIQVDRDAKQRIAAGDYLPAPEVTNLADLFNEEVEEQRWRVGGPSSSDDAVVTPGALDNTGLLAVAASVVLTGQRKAGKTSLVLDLVRCLVDADQFLGRFPVDRPDGGVYVMDYESTRAQARRWYHEAKIVHPQRVFLKLLRGQPNPFSTEPGRLELITEIRASKATVLIVDPLSVLLEALRQDENDNAGTRRGLDDLRRLATEAGVQEVIVIAHAGKTGERGARGASSIEDWPDAIWRLRVEGEGDTARRIFSAFGRDVDVEPAIINYDRETRRPVLSRTLEQAQRDEDAQRAENKAAIYRYLLTVRAGDAGDDADKGWRSKSKIKSEAGAGSKVDDLVDDLVLDGMAEFAERKVSNRTTTCYRAIPNE